MRRWKRWSRGKRVVSTALAVLVLATTSWAAISFTAEPGAKAVNLDAPVPPPQDVFIQKRNDTDGLGNAYVLVQLSREQVDAKREEGTADFLTLGTHEAIVILRDDGKGGDTTAGDGMFTGVANVDSADLARRGSEDQTTLNNRVDKRAPRFEGRAAVGIEEPAAFNYSGFTAGQVVRLGPAVAFVQPEGTTAAPVDEAEVGVSTIHSSGEPRSLTDRISSTTPVVPGTNTFQDRVLMVTNTDVIADSTRTWNPCTNTGAANGVWTFNHLMTQMTNPAASGIDPSDFVQNWLENWLDTNLTINEDDVPARTRMNSILNEWPKLSNGKLDLTKSPLRLLSINPRLDLRRTSGGGGAYSVNASGNFLDAGEARFIFGFVAKETATFNPATAFLGAARIGTSPCFALPFTVIFEYRIARCKCEDVRSWAKQWIDLKNWIPGTANYNNRLAALTEQFVRANANPRNPNGSSLGQLRTNEVALDAPWELREFQLTQFPFSFLQETTVEDTIRNHPGDDFNNNANATGMLRDWIENVVKPLLAANGNEAPVPLVPLFFRSSPVPPSSQETFMAGDSRTDETNPDFITFHWKEPGLDVVNDVTENWARHRVSRAACNGCHRRETFTHFVHVNPANTIILSIWNDVTNNWNPTPPLRADPALPAELSVFLTGINNLGDPANAVATGVPNDVRSPNKGNPKRNFDDLARRELDINQVGGMTCSGAHAVNVAHVKSSLQATGKLPTNLFEGLTLVPPGQRVSVAIDDMKRNVIREVH